MKMAHEMCGSQPVLLKKYKALIDDGFGMSFKDAMKEEVRRSIEHANSVTADAVEEARKQVTARGRDQQG
jgi:enoyl-CoA hydratase